jgi:hypothetical protein
MWCCSVNEHRCPVFGALKTAEYRQWPLSNDTPSHLDIPLKGCDLDLDRVPIVRGGDIVHPEMRIAGR